MLNLMRLTLPGKETVKEDTPLLKMFLTEEDKLLVSGHFLAHQCGWLSFY